MPRPIRWLLLFLSGLFALAVVAAAGIWLVGERGYASRQSIEVTGIAVPTDSAALERGAHLAAYLGCRGCHGGAWELVSLPATAPTVSMQR